MWLEASGSASEGEPFSFRVRRDGGLDHDTFAVVGVTDSAFPDIGPAAHPQDNGPGFRVVELDTGSNRGTGTVTPPFDGDNPSRRSLTISLEITKVSVDGTQRFYSAGSPMTLTIPVRDRDAVLRVNNATVNEGEGAKLEFVVTLSRVRDERIQVRYATSDGTALAGEDYEASSGMLVFNSGETAKTVEVAVLDDAHDEGTETLTLTLSNAVGARIADAEATGSINNSDPLPQGWLARFGRTSATQVVGLLDARFAEAAAPAAQLTLGGRRLPARNNAGGAGHRETAAKPAGARRLATAERRFPAAGRPASVLLTEQFQPVPVRTVGAGRDPG